MCYNIVLHYVCLVVVDPQPAAGPGLPPGRDLRHRPAAPWRRFRAAAAVGTGGQGGDLRRGGRRWRVPHQGGGFPGLGQIGPHLVQLRCQAAQWSCHAGSFVFLFSLFITKNFSCVCGRRGWNNFLFSKKKGYPLNPSLQKNIFLCYRFSILKCCNLLDWVSYYNNYWTAPQLNKPLTYF